ncbi:hypothetical protein BJ684DRAFT_15079 [Piptocephalis cylindrospora]|uniref:Uncharacterized protein n=1 Tax=Piptocephalis cylindrospora TaxID=1907219 RepID=A0A4P9Y6A0_9FUNG|nr:hypothetical protein BJ684DRAFT_15079 [Piptocephalis cylindrospora]|eukprot:RKP14606.1 hypothetical protein BJ684DRAFT_15079 [Piptocephalis cylindrospora]
MEYDALLAQQQGKDRYEGIHQDRFPKHTTGPSNPNTTAPSALMLFRLYSALSQSSLCSMNPLRPSRTCRSVSLPRLNALSFLLFFLLLSTTLALTSEPSKEVDESALSHSTSEEQPLLVSPKRRSPFRFVRKKWGNRPLFKGKRLFGRKPSKVPQLAREMIDGPAASSSSRSSTQRSSAVFRNIDAYIPKLVEPLPPDQRLGFSMTPVALENPARQVRRAFLILHDAILRALRGLVGTDITSRIRHGPSLQCLYDPYYVVQQWKKKEEKLQPIPYNNSKQWLEFMDHQENPIQAYSYAWNPNHFLHQRFFPSKSWYSRFLRPFLLGHPLRTFKGRIKWASRILYKHLNIVFDSNSFLSGVQMVPAAATSLRRMNCTAVVHARTRQVLVVDGVVGSTLLPDGEHLNKCNTKTMIGSGVKTKNPDTAWTDRKSAGKIATALIVSFLNLYQEVEAVRRIIHSVDSSTVGKEQDESLLRQIKDRSSLETLPLLTYPAYQDELAKRKAFANMDGAAPWADYEATSITPGNLHDLGEPDARWSRYQKGCIELEDIKKKRIQKFMQSWAREGKEHRLFTALATALKKKKLE